MGEWGSDVGVFFGVVSGVIFTTVVDEGVLMNVDKMAFNSLIQTGFPLLNQRF